MKPIRFVNLLVVLTLVGSTLACAQPAPPPAAPPPAASPAAPTVPAAQPAPTTAAPPATAAQPVSAGRAAQPGTTPPAGGLLPGATPTTAAPTKGESLKPPGANLTPTGKPAPSVFERSDVDALWVSGPPGQTKGGTSSVRVRVEKNTNREIRVGFFEEEVGGSGPMWRAAGWMAVIMSSFLLGVDPVDYTYSFDVGGVIDGPSAGALMTIATMASLLGHKVKADATMTGTINPDGTVGPVGGIPHKIDGAAARGKSLVLVPAGSRMSLDSNTNAPVDVVDRGRRLNVTVKEVSDVYEAYELLTGRPLPKPAGLKDVRPELPGAAFERAKGKSKEWFTRYWQLQTQYQALNPAYKFDLTESFMAQAKDGGDKADKYYQQGMASAAYGRALEATVYASAGYQLSKVVEAYANGGLDSALTYMKSIQTASMKVDALLDRLQTQKPGTLGDAIALADAYGSINLAMGLSNLAGSMLQRKVSTKEEALTVLTVATLYYAFADHSVELAKDAIDLGWGFGTTPAPADEKIASLAELFRRAADANLNYFDAVVLDEVAKSAGVHAEVVKAKFAQQDSNYMFAISAMQNLSALRQRAGPGTAGLYATFGGALSSYVSSSGLVAKYYSLGVQVDREGSVTGVKNERAMINMLDFAEKRARETIGLAASLNTDVVHPVLYFEDGKARREGGIEAKFSALTDFWSAVMESMALAILSGKASVLGAR